MYNEIKSNKIRYTRVDLSKWSDQPAMREKPAKACQIMLVRHERLLDSVGAKLSQTMNSRMTASSLLVTYQTMRTELRRPLGFLLASGLTYSSPLGTMSCGSGKKLLTSSIPLVGF